MSSKEKKEVIISVLYKSGSKILTQNLQNKKIQEYYLVV